MFILLYFLIPGWLESRISEQSGNQHYLFIEALVGRRIHFFKWVGIACGIVGLYFGIRRLCLVTTPGQKEKSIIAILARLISRRIE